MRYAARCMKGRAGSGPTPRGSLSLVRSIEEEAITQSLLFESDDYAEMKAARTEEREPKYRGR